MNAEEKVYRYIRKEIVGQTLLPGAQIIETQVAEQTGISRTPIRAALKRLAYEGMVVIRPNKGAYVVNPTPKEVRDTYECMMLLELKAIELACEMISDEEIERMEALVEAGVGIILHHDFDSYLDYNYEMHMMSVRACNNKLLEKYIGELLVTSNIHLLIYDDFRETPFEEFEAQKEHMEIVEALKSRDKKRCVQAVAKHINTTYYTLGLPLKLRIGLPELMEE